VGKQKLQAFISSKMAELAPERDVVKEKLSDLAEAWVFEKDAGAQPQTIQDSYLEALGDADIYIGIFWKGYGEYTIEEFEYAQKLELPCLIYEKRTELEDRDKELQDFLDSISQVTKGYTIQWFDTPEELDQYIHRDVLAWLTKMARKGEASRKSITINESPHFKAAPKRMRLKFNALIKDKLERFVGRQFIFDAIDEFVESEEYDSGYFLIRGEPGIGKSALIAKYINDHGLIHHFNIASEGIKSVSDFYENVILQVISKYNLDMGEWPERATQDSRFFVECLGKAAHNQENHPIIIAVDAIDESDQSTLPSSANSLLLPSYLPEGVFVIVTSRFLDEYRLNVSKIKILNLESDSKGNLQDVEEYIWGFVPREKIQNRINAWSVTDDIFVEKLKQKSEGNFIYLYYVLPAIEGGTFEQGTIDELPHGLREYYQRHWRQMKEANQKKFDKVYKRVVCILGVAQEPVNVQQISKWTKIDPELVSEGIRRWRQFLDGEPMGNPKLFRIYHASFQDYLKDKVELTAYDKMIADYYLEMVGKKRESTRSNLNPFDQELSVKPDLIEEPIQDGIQFSCYYPSEIAPKIWKPIASYVHYLSASANVLADAQNYFQQQWNVIRQASKISFQQLPKGINITSIPHIDGFEFNPSRATLGFHEDWIRFSFRIRSINPQFEKSYNGSITFYAEGILIAEIPLSIHVTQKPKKLEPCMGKRDPYRSIFPSYSHDDTHIVERCEAVYSALGMDFLRDVISIKSGQYWSEEISKFIKRADIFQLFWSKAAAQSSYVRDEWKFALGLGHSKENFIRPVYWEKPLRSVPSELGHIHFVYQPKLIGL